MENNEFDLLKNFEVEELEDRMEFGLWAPEPCYDVTYTRVESVSYGMTDSGLGIYGYKEVEVTETICPD